MTNDAGYELENWPAVLRELAEVIGPARALDLAREVGGLEKVYIPAHSNTGHFWTQVLTGDEWAHVVEIWGGQRISLPRGVHIVNRKARILAMAERGEATRRIALALRMTERCVRRTLAEAGMTAPRGKRLHVPPSAKTPQKGTKKGGK